MGLSARLIIGGGSLNADCELKERPPPVKKERKVLVKKKRPSSVERVEQGVRCAFLAAENCLVLGFQAVIGEKKNEMNSRNKPG